VRDAPTLKALHQVVSNKGGRTKKVEKELPAKNASPVARKFNIKFIVEGRFSDDVWG